MERQAVLKSNRGLQRINLLKGHLTKGSEFPKVERLKVCIIGGGPAGLASTKHFKQYHDVDTFEGREDIGGLWNYSPISELTHPDLENDEFYKVAGHLNPSIYENMTTNLPKYLMTLKDFFKDDLPVMLKPEDYHGYLKAYADHFKLRDQIHLNTVVQKVRLVKNLPSEVLDSLSPTQKSRKFLVTTINTKSKIVKSETYDHIVSCQGRNSKKFIPKLKGQEEYEGDQLHMHEFRKIDYEYYKDRTILVVGTSISAMDYMYHLLMSPWKADVKRIYVIGTTMTFIRKSTDFKPYIEQGKVVLCEKYIQELGPGKKVTLKNGTEMEIDTIMYATGYQFSFPFLDKADGILEVEQEKSGGRYVFPAYKRMVSCTEPNFTFIGALTGSPFPLAGVDRQVMFSLCIANKWVKLPSEKERKEESQRDIDVTVAFFGEKYDKVFKYNYITMNPIIYAEDLLGMINKSGVVKYKLDTAFNAWSGVETRFIISVMNGDYLSAKAMDYEKDFADAIKTFKTKTPSSKYF